MTDSAEEVSASEVLLNDLGEWAVRNGATDDIYLSLLADVLAGNVSPTTLRGLDPDKWFPLPQTRISSRVAWVIRLLSILRNVLIFAPVAITWLAISQATAAFNEYVQQNQGVPVNFLQFWQDGYGILPAEWTISNVALLDFGIIIVIAMLSLAIGGGQTFGSRTVSRSLAIQSKARRSLLVRLMREIPEMVTTAHSGAPQTGTKDIEAVLSRLEKLIERLEPQLRGFSQTISDANDAISNLRDAGVGASDSLSGATGTTESVLRELGSHIATLNEAASKSITSVSAMDRTASVVSKKFDVTAGELHAASSETRAALVKLSKALAAITDSID